MSIIAIRVFAFLIFDSTSPTTDDRFVLKDSDFFDCFSFPSFPTIAKYSAIFSFCAIEYLLIQETEVSVVLLILEMTGYERC